MNEFNPFLISTYRGPDYFCDRERETAQLIQFLNNQQSVSLFSHRRLGKTGLVKHVFHSLQSQKRTKCIYMDILGCGNLRDFTDALATAIYSLFPPTHTLGKKITTAIQSLRPVITFDELTGAPSLSLRAELPHEHEANLRQLFSFLDQKNWQILIAIDEFQQILEFPEKNVEALLRTQMQQMQHVQFIFCGSNQRMMHELFNSAKRPFFASCTPLYLDKIPEEKYKAFIRFHFEKGKRTITPDALEFVCKWTNLHTYYTQYVCNFLFASGIKRIELGDAFRAAAEILVIHENTFYQYRNLLTSGQWELLQAIAREGQVYQPSAKAFIQRHKLGTPSSIKRTLDALLEKEMIFYNNSVSRPYYEVYNKFLMRWLAKH